MLKITSFGSDNQFAEGCKVSFINVNTLDFNDKVLSLIR